MTEAGKRLLAILKAYAGEMAQERCSIRFE